MPIPRLKPYNGPAILSYGFRPFFLLGALYSGLSVLLWLPFFYGELQLATLFAPVDWHIHELYFGFLPAIITGFLFTAVPNWTGRMPIQGTPLLLLVLLWLSGRLAVSFSAFIGWQIAMVIDLSFLAAIVAVTGREIVAGKNWKNLKVLIPISLLLTANLIFHLETHYLGISDISRRLAIFAVVTLIMLIGGRIIPSFTRNWLARENPGRLPAQFDRLDVVIIAVSVIALAAWTLLPDHWLTGFALTLAAAGQLFRLARWAGYRCFTEPLVLVLHLAYLFVPIGFGLLAMAIFMPETTTQIAGIHALSVGTIGGMTLSVMVRASLGHTGQNLRANLPTKILFVSVFVAAVARICAGLDLGNADLLLHVAAFAWLFAFVGFALVIGPALVRPRAGRNP